MIVLDWPNDPDLRQVGALVLGGAAARTEAPIDRVEEIGFALDSLALSISGPRARLEISTSDELLRVSIGPFAADPLLDEDVGRVIHPLVDDATAEDREGAAWVSLTLRLLPARG